MAIATNQLQKTRAVYREYPRQFWLLILASFIDRLGGALVFTFFAIYIANKFKVGLTEVGLVSVIWGVTGLFGNFFGGALADKFGRKGVMIFGLVISATSSIGLGLASELWMLYAVTVFVGLFGSVGEPASHAMISDMLPKAQRAEGYSIHRMAFNMAVVLGPVIGGFLATRSYMLLFITDAITSLIMAGFILFLLEETWRPTEEIELESTLQTIRSYRNVLADRVFISFIGIVVITQFVYFQMYMTLPVFLTKVHEQPPSGFGYIMSLNAAMVVLMQFWITRKLRGIPPMITMAIACLFFMVGFGMYSFVSLYALFLLAMAFITIGEMVYFPTAQAFVAELAPEEMRGRYMAIYGLSFAIPSSFGTLFAGVISDNIDPYLIWYIVSMGALLATMGYLALHRSHTREKIQTPAAPTPVSTLAE